MVICNILLLNNKDKEKSYAIEFNVNKEFVTTTILNEKEFLNFIKIIEEFKKEVL